ncbi:hypothetical protein P261_02894 [Lachnospiraceae bacterium TWA4]|nr:hypothetical protein P261_02894 [Lachnospiraceae bacterium TWA4]
MAIKGENITWEDFERFPHEDIGSGRYIYKYDMVDGNSLILNGNKLDSPPECIYIIDSNSSIKEVLKGADFLNTIP